MKWRLEFLKRLSSIDLFYASEFEIVDLIMILKKIFQFFKNAAPHFWIVAQDDGGEEAVGQQRHGHPAQVHQLPTRAVVHILGRILQVLVEPLWKIHRRLVRNVRYSLRGWNMFTSPKTFSDLYLLNPRQGLYMNKLFASGSTAKIIFFVLHPRQKAILDQQVLNFVQSHWTQEEKKHLSRAVTLFGCSCSVTACPNY